ncbi:MAG: RimK family alpha-L-glutamate ligase [Patescibacteria group bacterium]
MKILILTNFPKLEVERIKNEGELQGHQITVVNPHGSLPIIQNDKLVIEGITDQKADLVIARSILYSIKELVALLSHLKTTGTKVFDNNLISLNYSINKVADLMRLTMAGIPVPNTRHSHDFEHFVSFGSQLKYPLVVKPTSTGQGVGVAKIENEGELLSFTEKAIKEGQSASRFIMQEFVPYVYDLRLLIIGEAVFCMRRIPREGDFRANFSLGGTVELFIPGEDTIALAKKALKAVGMTIGGIDILITKDKQIVLEVNHNPGFEGMEIATGQNIAKIYFDHVLETAI